ncbi:MAG: hypothetical protein LBK66_05180 [Spirochaetaceae bacterium]|jgi:hypothetical protein|nr:hypothetical protein [Spirochaetaceae bacterium]
MRKAKYLAAASVIAVIAAMTAIVSCSAAEGSIDPGGETKGSYTIGVMKTEHGSIKASRSAANAGWQVTVDVTPAEASEWSGGGDPPSIPQGGGGATANTLGI